MMQGMTAFPTIDPRGLFGTPKPNGAPGIGTFLHSSIEAYHANERRKARRRIIEATTPSPHAYDRLVRALNKHPRAFTSSRDRTTSFRKRAGSRKGNGRRSTLKDRGWELDWDKCPYQCTCYGLG